MKPDFSFIYDVTIRRYKEDLFKNQEYNDVDVFVLANGLREATDKAEDYAELVNQEGPYKFYEVVSVTECDEIYTGSGIEKDTDTPEYTFVLSTHHISGEVY